VISVGPANESTQTLANPSFTNILPAGSLASGPSFNTTTGELDFTPTADFNGNITFDFTIDDSASGTSSVVGFSITVNAVNDQPSFAVGGPVSVAEDSGAYGPTAIASTIVTGPADESAQTVVFNITGNSNPALFSVLPSIASNGDLTFTTAPDANGSATISVEMQDNGGTANGGVDTSTTEVFTIILTPVNDAPIIRLATSGSSFGVTSAVRFDTSVDPTSLPSDVSLEVYDVDGDALTTSVTIGATPAGINTPAALVAQASGTVFSWTGDAATSPVGLHDYTVTVSDGSIVTPYVVGITVNDLQPVHQVGASVGDGSVTTPYTATTSIGINPTIMVAFVSDPNESQNLSQVSIQEITSFGRFTASFNNVAHTASIVLSSNQTLTYLDVGTHTFLVTYSDGGAHTTEQVYVAIDVLLQGNVQPVAGLPGTTDFTGNQAAGFDASVNPAATLADALIQLTDVDGDAVSVTAITTSPAALANMNQPAINTTALPPYNINFNGTADAFETPGVYTYTVTITDNITAPVTFDVRITLVDVPPVFVPGADALNGSGTSVDPFTFTYQVSSTPAGVEVALLSDENLGQTLSVAGINYGSSPTSVFDFPLTTNGSDGILELEAIAALLAADLGVHDIIVTISDGGANTIDIYIEVTVVPKSGGGGGGKDDGGGCASAPANNYPLWLVLFSLVAVISLRRRRRNA
jgi:hypothetical protein